MILVNGSLNDRIDALDRGLAYGDGVFRTMRAIGTEIPFWTRHYRKLASDCAALGLTCPDELLLRAELARLLERDPDCVLKVIVTRGVGGRGYAPPAEAAHTRIVASFPAPAVHPEIDRRGVRVRWCETRLAIQPRLAGVKHLNRIENVVARAEWDDPNVLEGIMLDTAERVIEATACNLFLLERDGLVTPDLSRCGVAGVQRDRIMEVALRLGLPCEPAEVTRSRVSRARQLLLVNSVIGVWWVAELEGLQWKKCDETTAITGAIKDLAD